MTARVLIEAGRRHVGGRPRPNGWQRLEHGSRSSTLASKEAWLASPTIGLGRGRRARARRSLGAQFLTRAGAPSASGRDSASSDSSPPLDPMAASRGARRPAPQRAGLPQPTRSTERALRLPPRGRGPPGGAVRRRAEEPPGRAWTRAREGLREVGDVASRSSRRADPGRWPLPPPPSPGPRVTRGPGSPRRRRPRPGSTAPAPVAAPRPRTGRLGRAGRPPGARPPHRRVHARSSCPLPPGVPGPSRTPRRP